MTSNDSLSLDELISGQLKKRHKGRKSLFDIEGGDDAGIGVVAGPNINENFVFLC